jgi:hypothetical protein
MPGEDPATLRQPAEIGRAIAELIEGGFDAGTVLRLPPRPLAAPAVPDAGTRAPPDAVPGTDPCAAPGIASDTPQGPTPPA